MGVRHRGRRMRDYLVFQLYGPLSSWGDIAVGETRPSGVAPAKSAVIGLVAAGLGLRRPDTTQNETERRLREAEHAALAEGYGMAVKLTHPGLPLADYHTAQVPSSGSGRNKKVFSMRRDELTWMPRHDLSTILSRRDYRQDAFSAVALWAREGAPYPLADLRNKLFQPVFTLYLGRKSCPPALPLSPAIMSADCFEDALSESSFAQATKELLDRGRIEESSVMFFWDADAETRLSAEQIVTRRDSLLSRRRWQFTVREERRAHLPSGGQT